MKRGGLAVMLGLLSLALFLYVQPLLTIRVLAKALEASDVEAIRERMDAERVRQGLRDDFRSRPAEKAGVVNQSAAEVVAMALFGRGIEMILATHASGITTDDGSATTEIADWGYDGPSRFRAKLEQPSRASITLVLERQGTSWQVIAMQPAEAAWRELEPFTGS
jgi:hypothetical protein